MGGAKRGVGGLPPLRGAIRHSRSSDGLGRLWRKIARTVYSPRILSGLPRFARYIAKTFPDTDPAAVVSAVRGDPAFFVAYQLRLDQLDLAMIDAGRTIADRAPLIRAKWILDGFRETSVNALIKRGGTWPPLPQKSSPQEQPPEEPTGVEPA